MKFELKTINRNTTLEIILEDLKSVATKQGKKELSVRQYQANGAKFGVTTILRRFGSWNNALTEAGLTPNPNIPPTKLELFNNIQELWLKLGRQPRYKEFKFPLSAFTPSPYVSKWGSFSGGMLAFVDFVNESNQREIPLYKDAAGHRTPRNPNNKLKVLVLMRDGNKCKECNKQLSAESIHFDHIIPWSKGGETTLENLQILCPYHNLKKGSS